MNTKQKIDWGSMIGGAILLIFGLIGLGRYLGGREITVRVLCGTPLVIILGIWLMIRGFKGGNS